MRLPIQAAPILRHNLVNSNKIKTSGVEPQGWCSSKPNCDLNARGEMMDTQTDCCEQYPYGSWEGDNGCVNCQPQLNIFERRNAVPNINYQQHIFGRRNAVPNIRFN